MPIPFFAEIAFNGIPGGVSYWTALKGIVALGIFSLIKWYCNGAPNTSERQMHSKVIMITGGTTGIGASTAFHLAKRGAQIVLLTHHSPSDIFLVDYIEDLRNRSGNQLIYAEQVDLSSTHSIRKFATKWIDNAPPRRLDMIILCATTRTPPGKPRVLTSEGIEETWMINYISNFHLLSILSPALRAQPADRDVRIIFATCSSYIASPSPLTVEDALDAKAWTSAKAYARSKLAVLVFGQAFQKHLERYKRPDGAPMNARIVFVDPGYTRTPGMRRYLTRGTLWGLALYLLFYPAVWLFLKSSEQGAQSFLYAAMEATLGRGSGGKLIKECMEVDFARMEVKDDGVAKGLWEGSDKFIERVEREEAVKRAMLKKEMEAKEKAGKVKEKVKIKGNNSSKRDEVASSESSIEVQRPNPRRARKAA